jgi:uncharacterized phage protein gp47/JayE
MAITVTSIDDLDADSVAELQDEFSELVAERHPEIETIRGPFHDLVSYFAGGISGGVNQEEMSRLQQSMSLAAIEANPALADDDYVDAVLSNYLVTRKTGSLATGEVTIVVSEDETTIISGGLIFTASGAQFQVDRAYTARPSGSTAAGISERVLQPLGDGTYSFTIDATALEIGEASNISRGTLLTPSAPPDNYVTSYAATDFSGGTDTELNADLMARLQLGIAAKVMQGRVNIEALVKEQSLFSDTLDYSVVGYGNAEMLRDQHGILPISSGGRLDIYSRTSPLPQTVSLTKEATFMETTAAGGLWQFSLDKDDAPGFYEVVQVILPSDPADTAGFEVTSDLRGLDLPVDQFAPDLIDSVEGAYTRYQTAVIRFEDTATDHSALTPGTSKQNYTVGVQAMPLIKELQVFCNGADVRNLSADVAVKAAVPCFLTINLEIQIGAETAAPATGPIKTALAAAVNNIGFPGQLHASLIHDVVHNYLTNRQAVGAIDLHGRIRRPNGTTQIIRASDVLQAPDDPGNLVTGSTVAFILGVNNIGISVVTTGYATEV